MFEQETYVVDESRLFSLRVQRVGNDAETILHQVARLFVPFGYI
jgi:hypothetical protein